MKIAKIGYLSALVLFSSFCLNAQTAPKTIVLKSAVSVAKASPAYAELLLRKTERESELEEFALDYTDEFPKVQEIKFELGSINKELNRVLAVSAADSAKLTLALGKLLVRKTEVETDLWNLRKQYNADHPEVKRANRKVEIFEKAIKEILQ